MLPNNSLRARKEGSNCKVWSITGYVTKCLFDTNKWDAVSPVSLQDLNNKHVRLQAILYSTNSIGLLISWRTLLLVHWSRTILLETSCSVNRYFSKDKSFVFLRTNFPLNNPVTLARHLSHCSNICGLHSAGDYIDLWWDPRSAQLSLNTIVWMTKMIALKNNC